MLRGNAKQTIFHGDEEFLEQLRHGSGTKEGLILGNEDFIKDVLKQNNETVQAEITIEQLVDVAANACQVSPREITSASRARNLAVYYYLARHQ